MAAKSDQQLRLLIEHLHPVLHAIRHPDVPIGIDCHSFGAREISRAVAGFAERAHEFAVGVKNLDAVVHGVADV